MRSKLATTYRLAANLTAVVLFALIWRAASPVDGPKTSGSFPSPARVDTSLPALATGGTSTPAEELPSPLDTSNLFVPTGEAAGVLPTASEPLTAAGDAAGAGDSPVTTPDSGGEIVSLAPDGPEVAEPPELSPDPEPATDASPVPPAESPTVPAEEAPPATAAEAPPVPPEEGSPAAEVAKDELEATSTSLSPSPEEAVTATLEPTLTTPTDEAFRPDSGENTLLSQPIAATPDLSPEASSPSAEAPPLLQPDESGALRVAEQSHQPTTSLPHPGGVEVLEQNLYWLGSVDKLSAERANLPERLRLVILSPTPGEGPPVYAGLPALTLPALAGQLDNDAAERFLRAIQVTTGREVVVAFLPDTRTAAFFKGAYLRVKKNPDPEQLLQEIAPELELAGEERGEIIHRLERLEVETLRSVLSK
ncbi:MAG: hypothetical protein LBU79_09850 [Planctomycetota bacterium]|jgi:hypothetical protein|nr:hypothetical protein [Planctomycetota bacterium]